MALVSRIDFKLTTTLTGAGDHGVPTVSSVIEKALGMTTGTGLGMADKTWSDQRTLTQATNEDLDLAAVLTDGLGVAFSPARIKGIVFHSLAANVVNLTISRGATNGVPWLSAVSSGVLLPPNGLLVLWVPSAAGIVVTAGTGDLINVAASAGASDAVYDVAFIGASA